MRFYQVNQRRTFKREFNGGYLCSPSGNWGNWPLMKELRTGDILFNYNSTCAGGGAVLGISWVTNIGEHKGAASHTAVISGTQCIQYSGRHLSEDDFSPKDREHYRRTYPRYFEVHTVPLRSANLGRLLPKTPRRYLVPISDPAARSFLQKCDIRLEDLSFDPNV
jgi:predicted outer membrane repeat protein